MTALVGASAGALSAQVGALSSIAEAGPPPANHLTINAVPGPINAGEGVLIYGQLMGAGSAAQPITLYHRVNPSPAFTAVATTTTAAGGSYEFTRAEGVVISNRSWFVRGPAGTQSRTVHEQVAALVSLAPSTVPAVTGEAVAWSGEVSPAHPSEQVQLQEQNALAGGGWTTVATAVTDAGSKFNLSHRWAIPGYYTLRALLPGDARNIEGTSDVSTVTVQQDQEPSFTINSSSPTIPAGQTVTISGVLYEPSRTTGEANVEVALYGKPSGGASTLLNTTTTAADGSYNFTESPSRNEIYRVQTAQSPYRTTSSLYEGVEDVVTVRPGSSTGVVGGTLTISGTVAPDHTGHVIYLQRMGSDGYWHNVLAGVVTTGSAYSFGYTPGQTGEIELRARLYGGAEDIGGASTPVVVTVTGVAPFSSLPLAS